MALARCPECDRPDGLRELLRLVELSDVTCELVDGELRVTPAPDASSELISGQRLGFACRHCGAEFPTPAT